MSALLHSLQMRLLVTCFASSLLAAASAADSPDPPVLGTNTFSIVPGEFPGAPDPAAAELVATTLDVDTLALGGQSAVSFDETLPLPPPSAPSDSLFRRPLFWVPFAGCCILTLTLAVCLKRRRASS